ncbi:hypothetical protein ONZ51_g12064 [Trametes cubensis]|uniref:Uncharacterized protein n=1 Tax=Trametes cubensis TaxID=1111947 RepID=A0AAD7THA2_9APHY|nr:hypothetical protein ONZ51_g12064 [Trametes cubensis]
MSENSTPPPLDCPPVLESERRRRTFEFQDYRPLSPYASNIYQLSPEELVDKALNALQGANIQLIEWKTLLYQRMGVPVVSKDFHYLVPDIHILLASAILEEDQGLPQSIPPPLLLRTGGEIYSKATLYRVTRYTSAARAQHLVIYPASFISYAPSELEPKPYLTSLSSPLCKTVLVPTPPAMYASLIRLIRSYTRYDPTRMMLESDLSELIGYHLYGLQGYVDVDDEVLCEDLQVLRRVEDAVRVVKEWRDTHRFREEERWIADALVNVVSGKWSCEDIPWAEPVHKS